MPSLFPLDNFLGVLFVGIIVSTVLYGVNCLQAYTYYTRFCAADSRWLQLLVALVLALDTLHVALICAAYYHYTVTNYGDYIALNRVTWSIVVQVAIGTLEGTIVQLFFAKRIHDLGRGKLHIPVIIGILAVTPFGCSIAYAIAGTDFKGGFVNVTVTPHNIDTYTSTALAVNIACDLMIGSTVVYYLRQGRTGFHQTDKVINVLVTYALSTCLLAMIFSIACLITWAVTDGLIYALFYFVLARVYPCSLLSTLNTRSVLRYAIGAADPACELHFVGASSSDSTSKDGGFSPPGAVRVYQSSSRAKGNGPLPLYHLSKNTGDPGGILVSTTTTVV